MIDKSNWSKVKFGDVVKNVNITIKPTSNEHFERIVGLEHMDGGNLHIYRWAINDGESSFVKIFKTGQTLFAKRRAYQRKVAFAEFEGICSGDILVLESKNRELLHPELLPFICMSEAFYNFVESNSQGSLSPRVAFTALANFEILLPPIDEQKCIAEILWTADDVVESYVKVNIQLCILMRKLEDKYFLLHEVVKKSPFLPSGWNIGTFDTLAIIDPSMPRNISAKQVTFIPMESISETGRIVSTRTEDLETVKKGYTYFAEDDILFAKITPCMENGKGALAEGLENGIGFGSTEFFVIRSKKSTDTEYLFALTMASAYRKRAERWMQGSAGQRRVPKDFFSKRPIAIPPSNIRKQIGKIFSEVKHELSRIESQQTIAKNLRDNLINKYF
ncbi:MAG: restriction endonuclease subunit S [Carboxydocellales bacterium]